MNRDFKIDTNLHILAKLGLKYLKGPNVKQSAIKIHLERAGDRINDKSPIL